MYLMKEKLWYNELKLTCGIIIDKQPVDVDFKAEPNIFLKRKEFLQVLEHRSTGTYKLLELELLKILFWFGTGTDNETETFCQKSSNFNKQFTYKSTKSYLHYYLLLLLCIIMVAESTHWFIYFLLQLALLITLLFKPKFYILCTIVRRPKTFFSDTRYKLNKRSYKKDDV